MAKPTTELYTITLRPLPDPDGVPPLIRLRKFLKMSLRGYGLRCVRCEAVPETGEEIDEWEEV